jgi:uncharacterized protein (TIGR04255 family)
MVLAQVRFSPLANVATYVPAIQDRFRRKGFPLLSQIEGKSIHMNSGGFREEAIQQWRFDSADRHSTIILDAGQIMFQTTKYERFEDFCRRLLELYNEVCTVTEHDKFGVVQRIGLRYINQVKVMEEGKTWKDYLQPSFHGLSLKDDVRNVLHATVTQAETTLPGLKTPGTLLVRMTQNIDGLRLPPDLLDFAPETGMEPKGSRITLVDLDHYQIGELIPPVDSAELEKGFFALHDVIIETLHESVLTEQAVRSWT